MAGITGAQNAVHVSLAAAEKLWQAMTADGELENSSTPEEFATGHRVFLATECRIPARRANNGIWKQKIAPDAIRSEANANRLISLIAEADELFQALIEATEAKTGKRETSHMAQFVSPLGSKVLIRVTPSTGFVEDEDDDEDYEDEPEG